jgi:glutathione S-transferase
MKLYYAPGACSMAPHIVLNEVGAKFEAEKVDLGRKKTASGDDYLAINNKGSVPALQLADGSVLTEASTIMQYVADTAGSKLVAPAGSMERYRQQEMLNFIAADLHKSIGSLYNKDMAAKAGDVIKTNIARRLTWLEGHLAGKDYLMGKEFSVADAYAFTVIGWTKHVGVDISGYPTIGAYLGRVASRPAVQATLKAEGLA